MRSQERGWEGQGGWLGVGRGTMWHPDERTTVDVRIGVTQTARDISLELADDLDRDAVKAKIDAALNGAVDVLWLTDKKGREVGVSAAKIAFVELGTAEGDRRIGFGG